MREKLVELVQTSLMKHIGESCRLAENIADYLLENGVIVLPCQKGAVLIRDNQKCVADHWNVLLTAFNEEHHVRLFGIEEAEQALKEREKT